MSSPSSSRVRAVAGLVPGHGLLPAVHPVCVPARRRAAGLALRHARPARPHPAAAGRHPGAGLQLDRGLRARPGGRVLEVGGSCVLCMCGGQGPARVLLGTPCLSSLPVCNARAERRHHTASDPLALTPAATPASTCLMPCWWPATPAWQSSSTAATPRSTGAPRRQRRAERCVQAGPGQCACMWGLHPGFALSMQPGRPAEF